MNKIYFLCSQSVVEHFPEAEKSKPFKSGYEWDKEDCYCVAVLDFKKVSKYFQEVIEPFNEKSNIEDIDFWLRECCAGSMDVSKITIAAAKRNGLFVEIENKVGLTNEKNRAMVVNNLPQKYNCTPIELINKIAYQTSITSPPQTTNNDRK